MFRPLRHFPYAAATVSLALGACSVCAQTFRGGINGNVTDSTGAAVSGATVTATDVSTGVKTAGVSSSSGGFLFEDLPLGEYTIVVAASGFANTRVDHVNVSAGSSYLDVL